MTRLPISEEYFQRLLSGDPSPLNCVSQLAGYWSDRLHGETTRGELSLVEYDVQLCLVYTGEVGNGGHSQYFHNHGLEIAVPTLEALERVGLPELRSVLEQAIKILPAKPMNLQELRAELFGMTANCLSRLRPLDIQVWQLRGTDERLLSYLRAHQSEVLVDLRG